MDCLERSECILLFTVLSMFSFLLGVYKYHISTVIICLFTNQMVIWRYHVIALILLNAVSRDNYQMWTVKPGRCGMRPVANVKW